MTTDPKQPEAQEAPASAWDERMQFEKWAKKEFGQGQVTRANTEAYVWDHVEDAWRTWQARAALGKQPTQEAPPVAAVLSEQEIDDILMRQTSLEAAGSDVFWRADGALVAKDELRMFAWECVHAARRAQEAPADAKDAVLVRLRRLIRILDAGRDVDGYKGQSALQEAVDAIEAYRAKAARYDYLRSRDLDTISKGGVFAGQVPQNYVLSGVDLDRAIDSALQSHQEGK